MIFRKNSLSMSKEKQKKTKKYGCKLLHNFCNLPSRGPTGRGFDRSNATTILTLTNAAHLGLSFVSVFYCRYINISITQIDKQINKQTNKF